MNCIQFQGQSLAVPTAILALDLNHSDMNRVTYALHEFNRAYGALLSDPTQFLQFVVRGSMPFDAHTSMASVFARELQVYGDASATQVTPELLHDRLVPHDDWGAAWSVLLAELGMTIAQLMECVAKALDAYPQERARQQAAAMDHLEHELQGLEVEEGVDLAGLHDKKRSAVDMIDDVATKAPFKGSTEGASGAMVGASGAMVGASGAMVGASGAMVDASGMGALQALGVQVHALSAKIRGLPCLDPLELHAFADEMHALEGQVRALARLDDDPVGGFWGGIPARSLRAFANFLQCSPSQVTLSALLSAEGVMPRFAQGIQRDVGWVRPRLVENASTAFAALSPIMLGTHMTFHALITILHTALKV